jgi:Flp pilus assembly protein TadD
VSRAELQHVLWGDTAVDAEAGLNHCVRQVRRALGDQAGAPRFVATEPRRGYRFVGRVELVDEHAGATTMPSLRRVTQVATVLLLLVATGAFLYHRHATPGTTSSEAIPPQVFADFERARYLLRQPGVEPAGRALSLLERVVQLAPDFAPGHAALARALLQSDPFATGRRARRHVERALELAPALPGALVVRGDIRSLIDHDWHAAARDFERAQEADPAPVEALHHHAGVLALLGRHPEAIELMERALQLDPVSPLLAGDLAWFHFAARDWRAARDWAHRTLELEPDQGAARSVLLHAAARIGDAGEVRRQDAAGCGR